MSRVYMKYPSETPAKSTKCLKNKKEFVNFIETTLFGLNHAMFRSIIDKTRKDLKTKSVFDQEVTMRYLFMNTLARFLNDGYRALIYSCNGKMKREQDKKEFYIKCFEQFVDPEDCYICFLKKIRGILSELGVKIKYSEIDFSDLQSFSDDLKEQIKDLMKEKDIDTNLCCNCDEDDHISNWDPSRDLFRCDLIV